MTDFPNNPAEVGRYRCGPGQPLLILAGPCLIEDLSLTMSIARRLAELAEELPVQLVFKGSFDKANRTSIDARRGPGLETGLRILAQVSQETGLPVRIAEDPLTCVARGTGVFLEQLDQYSSVLDSIEDDF